MRNTHRSRAKGLTLMEILLVLLILGMLATVGILGLKGIRERAKKDVANLLVQEVASALEAFYMHLNRYPTEDEGLDALRNKHNFDDEADADKWAGVYLTKEPKDPWGNALNYEPVEADSDEASGQGFKVWSNGPNENSGDDDDINSWESDEET